MRASIFLFSLLILTITGCFSDERQRENEISKIPIELSSVRFDSLFFNTDSDKLPLLKNEFPFLFPNNTPDSLWIHKQKDTLETEIFSEVCKVFPTVRSEEKSLTTLFQHVKYVFPNFKAPQIIFLNSDVDYKNRMIYTDSLLLISLDCYLGADHHFYQNIQSYIRKDFSPDNLPVDAAYEIASSFVPKEHFLRNFIQNIVYEGKRQYLMSLFLSNLPEYKQLQFSEGEYLWAKANESDIWRYFIDNEYLYSSDKKLLNRFVYPAPFSKFYLDLDSESPGRIGVFIGYQIVKAYMKNNASTVQQMLSANGETLFMKSQYKPQQ